MKETDWRNTLEVAVKGLVIVIAALAGLYVLGWVFQFLGAVLLGVASIIVALLRWLVPVAIIAGVVYFVVTRISPKPSPTPPLYSSPSSPTTTAATPTNIAPVTPITPVSTAASPAVTTITVEPAEATIPSEPVSDPLDPAASVDDQTHSSNTKKSMKKDSSQGS